MIKGDLKEIIFDSGWIENDDWSKPHLEAPIESITFVLQPVDEKSKMRNVTPRQGLIESNDSAK